MLCQENIRLDRNQKMNDISFEIPNLRLPLGRKVGMTANWLYLRLPYNRQENYKLSHFFPAKANRRQLP